MDAAITQMSSSREQPVGTSARKGAKKAVTPNASRPHKIRRVNKKRKYLRRRFALRS
jgi:hypothetical protein